MAPEVKTYKCTHEWRQKFNFDNEVEELKDNGYYCIHCLKEKY